MTLKEKTRVIQRWAGVRLKFSCLMVWFPLLSLYGNLAGSRWLRRPLFGKQHGQGSLKWLACAASKSHDASAAKNFEQFKGSKRLRRGQSTPPKQTTREVLCSPSRSRGLYSKAGSKQDTGCALGWRWNEPLSQKFAVGFPVRKRSRQASSWSRQLRKEGLPAFQPIGREVASQGARFRRQLARFGDTLWGNARGNQKGYCKRFCAVGDSFSRGVPA